MKSHNSMVRILLSCVNVRVQALNIKNLLLGDLQSTWGSVY